MFHIYRIYIYITLLLVGISTTYAAQQRQIFVCVSDNASAAIKQAANDLVTNADTVPVLKALCHTQNVLPATVKSSEDIIANENLAAYNFLVVIGLRSQDKLVDKVWEHYATVDEKSKTLYMQGWGCLQGDLGYIDVDRNPFLHSRRIRSAPFETSLFKISGTSEAGVLAGIQAFRTGMLNGLVPVGEIKRPQQTILDLDPLVAPSPVRLPSSIFVGGSDAPLIGYTQVPGNEYRAYIDVAGAEPTRVWRFKYLPAQALDHAGVQGWMAGFHRMAYGNAVNIIEFPTEDAAKITAEAIGAQGGWKKTTDLPGLPAWQTNQPTDEVLDSSLGTVITTQKGRYVIMSTLPKDSTVQLVTNCTFPE
ncbi:MAG TPA: hypothetical protein VHV83_01770 [Armatimonadota bacterium]|nr:hypothetical protein [Armatimonadota bacterium]